MSCFCLWRNAVCFRNRRSTADQKTALAKQPTFCGRELLPLSVIEAVRVGDPLAVESVLRYYDGYMNKLCTRTLYDLDGLPHVRVDEHMKDRLQAKLTEVIVNKK